MDGWIGHAETFKTRCRQLAIRNIREKSIFTGAIELLKGGKIWAGYKYIMTHLNWWGNRQLQTTGPIGLGKWTICFANMKLFFICLFRQTREVVSNTKTCHCPTKRENFMSAPRFRLKRHLSCPAYKIVLKQFFAYSACIQTYLVSAAGGAAAAAAGRGSATCRSRGACLARAPPTPCIRSA